MVLRTSAVARLIGIKYTHLYSLLRQDLLVPPTRDSSGDYVWSEEDIERAREVLRARKERRKVKV